MDSEARSPAPSEPEIPSGAYSASVMPSQVHAMTNASSLRLYSQIRVLYLVQENMDAAKLAQGCMFACPDFGGTGVFLWEIRLSLS